MRTDQKGAHRFLFWRLFKSGIDYWNQLGRELPITQQQINHSLIHFTPCWESCLRPISCIQLNIEHLPLISLPPNSCIKIFASKHWFLFSSYNKKDNFSINSGQYNKQNVNNEKFFSARRNNVFFSPQNHYQKNCQNINKCVGAKLWTLSMKIFSLNVIKWWWLWFSFRCFHQRLEKRKFFSERTVFVQFNNLFIYEKIMRLLISKR